MKKRWIRLPLTYAKDREATTFYALALNMASPASDFGEFPLAHVAVLLFGVETRNRNLERIRSRSRRLAAPIKPHMRSHKFE